MRWGVAAGAVFVAASSSACVTPQETFRAQLCSPAGAREEGARDAAEGRPMSAAFADPCDPAARTQLLGAYRTGYVEAGQSAGEGRTATVPGATPARPPVAVPGARAFRCETSPFGTPISAYGATERAAREAVTATCTAKHGAGQCTDVKCGVGE
ncbi:MAG: hypothetical protein QM704_23870 [Anaeromyxobacteraceae bacterium]